ncbi:uncharacterized protein LOC125682097 isoform X2 [Ostrea edulis]|uniref:uncharacterized protein LOC125682097 isoform X2 n=1 Tax=Ostrea edulis TaxID=37623 RepID=UPI0024AEFB4B|nr:uncharacterized protein LOC125682097 isoform X2 [Ostrea edulis]XP_056010388.1 uncharacterized protein LOC125682097 isoform X2 [Ostrea edulis]XP_056010389.1 uncharacterized protein LOC125682097 isoform X2 [Ostrea edulis]XP_056010390.1 uncharacterized protein LOC125682097 isoform X2 [Ostrea edulis]
MPPRKRAATQRSPARGIGKKRNRRTPVQLRERSPPRTATSWTDRQAPAEGQSQPPEEAPQFPMDSTPDNPVGPFSKTCTRGRPVAYTTTSPHMGLIEQETSRLLDRSLAHNTHLAYNTALTKFKQFTLLYGFTSTWPVPVDQLLHYIAYLSLNQLTYRTICLHLSAIAYQHKIQGFQDTTKAFIITKALEGVKRSVGVNQDIRLPISYQLFVKIIHALTSVCRSPFESCLFSAAFSLAFYGLLRVSEVLSLLSSQVSQNQLGQVSIILHRSKTNQTGKPLVCQITKLPDTNFCPTLPIKAYLQLRPPPPILIHCSFMRMALL